jgi:hypothetical protein
MFKPETQPCEIAEGVKALIDAAIKEHRGKQAPRQYLGASRIGDECERRLAYEFHLTTKDEGAEFKANTLRIFDMGHDGEERVAEYLKLAGFDLVTHQADGKQFGISDAGDKFKGHLDGIINSGPAIKGLLYPCLWESKALGEKSWSDVVKKGLKESKPVYYAQVQIYMAYKDLLSCLFTAINRDTGEIHVEIVQFNARDAQSYIDRAVRIVKTDNPEQLGRIGRGVDDFKCKWCDYKKRCHGVSEQKTPDAEPPKTWAW